MFVFILAPGKDAPYRSGTIVSEGEIGSNFYYYPQTPRAGAAIKVQLMFRKGTSVPLMPHNDNQAVYRLSNFNRIRNAFSSYATSLYRSLRYCKTFIYITDEQRLLWRSK